MFLGRIFFIIKYKSYFKLVNTTTELLRIQSILSEHVSKKIKSFLSELKISIELLYVSCMHAYTEHLELDIHFVCGKQLQDQNDLLLFFLELYIYDNS